MATKRRELLPSWRKGITGPKPGIADIIKIGPCVSLMTVRYLCEGFGMAPSGMEAFLSELEVPIIEMGPYEDRKTLNKRVVVAALEMALLERGLPKRYRDRYSGDPTALAVLMNVLSMVHATRDPDELKARLQMLGDMLVKKALDGTKNSQWYRSTPRETARWRKEEDATSPTAKPNEESVG